MRYLVTIDREEWLPPRRWQIWRKHWWAMYTRRPELASGVGRHVYEVDRQSGVVRKAFELPQLLDRSVLGQSWMEQSSWTKSISRGLRAVTPVSNGNLVINDVFGVYETTASGSVVRYVTIPDVSDLHSAIPNTDNSRLLLANTGCEEVLEIDWNGKIHLRINLPALFGIAAGSKWIECRKKHPDARTMRFDHNRELFHVNWAEWIVPNEFILISCHTPGVVVVIDVRGESPRVTSTWNYFPHCHGPSLDESQKRLLVAISKTDQVREICTETGRVIWTTEGIGYGKRVLALDQNNALAADCTGKRLVEISRANGRINWEAKLPAMPYSIAVLN